jgi:hypothetical protein
VAVTSATNWIPIISSHSTLTSEVWQTFQSNTRNSVNVVENLTPQQRRAFTEQTNLNSYFPHVGLFAKDFVVGVILLKK